MRTTAENAEAMRIAAEAASPQNQAKMAQRFAGARNALPARMLSTGNFVERAAEFELKRDASFSVFAEAQKSIGTPEALGVLHQARNMVKARHAQNIWQRVLNSDDGKTAIKNDMLAKMQNSGISPEDVQALSNRFSVLACSTNYEANLRTSSSKAEVEQTEAGLNRPTNSPTYGTCLGRCSQFIQALQNGIENGTDVEQAAIAAATDVKNLVKGGIKHQVYRMEHDRSFSGIIAEATEKLAVATKKIEDANDTNSQLEAVEALQKQREENASKLAAGAINLIEKTGLPISDIRVGPDEASDNPIRQAIKFGEPSIVTDKEHAVVHFKHEGTHFSFDPARGLYKIEEPEIAFTILANSLEADDFDSGTFAYYAGWQEK